MRRRGSREAQLRGSGRRRHSHSRVRLAGGKAAPRTRPLLERLMGLILEGWRGAGGLALAGRGMLVKHAMWRF